MRKAKGVHIFHFNIAYVLEIGCDINLEIFSSIISKIKGLIVVKIFYKF